ncbi:hypothetical protein FACS1894110_18380 [Spirochaetia bacterium]|nr:hypothetical protein FACS1894110_18380 [Spirochaetia bacterium]
MGYLSTAGKQASSYRRGAGDGNAGTGGGEKSYRHETEGGRMRLYSEIGRKRRLVATGFTGEAVESPEAAAAVSAGRDVMGVKL